MTESTITSETTKFREIVDSKGFLTRTKIVELYTKIPRNGKYFILAYFSGAMMYNLVSSYNSGKIGLQKYRTIAHENSEKNNISQADKKKGEFEAIRNAIYETSYDRFWKSLFFPYTIASEIIPNVVLFLNKE